MNFLNPLSFPSTRNVKAIYYLKGLMRCLLPYRIFQWFLVDKLSEVRDYNRDYINARVDYYNRLRLDAHSVDNLKPISENTFPRKGRVYFFDSMEYLRYFRQDLKANLLFGDINYTPAIPSLTKTRPIGGNNSNAIIMKFNKIRHFKFVHDKTRYDDKKSMLIGRANVWQPHRIAFFEKYFEHPLCDLGQINQNENSVRWQKPKTSISDHLKYKFILCIEGNDVASNLKWVMSSNSIAVMPKPKYESWFMEGTLVPNFHYIEIKSDYSDLEERLQYYIDHPDEAKAIVRNANAFVQQFKDEKREDLISLLVLKKYFEQTGQLVLDGKVELGEVCA